MADFVTLSFLSPGLKINRVMRLYVGVCMWDILSVGGVCMLDGCVWGCIPVFPGKT